MLEEQLVEERVARAESLLTKLEGLPDPKTKRVAIEAVQALLDLYGEGLARMMAALAAEGRLPRAFTDDELISHLLLLHGLHPHDTETRVRAALRAAQPYLATQGGNVQVLGISGSVVRLRLVRSSSNGCGAAASHNGDLRDTIEQLILTAAPEVTRVETEGEASAPLTADGGFIPLGNLIEVDGHG